MEYKITIVRSKYMSENKKEDRNEHILIRLNKKARNVLNKKKDNYVLLSSEQYNIEKKYKIYKAFKKDLQKTEGIFDTELIGFLSNESFNNLFGEKKSVVINISTDFKNILIGTDPELLLFNEDNQIIHACTVPGLTKQSKFGSDGAMAELRPDPSYTPNQLISNIRNILTNNKYEPVGSYYWKSACYQDTDTRDYPVGTHIHFDNPFHFDILSNDQKMRIFAVTNKILDELLTLPMIRLDGKQGYNRRAHCKMSHAAGFGNNYSKGYGFFGEWRVCNGHLEHRSLSGLVISNPNLCKNVFATAKLIVEAVYKEIINNNFDNEFVLPEKFNRQELYNKNFKHWEEIPLAETFGCITTSEVMNLLMNNSSRTDISKKYIKRWIKIIRNLPTYNKYENYVEELGDFLLSSSKNLQNINTNIKKTWEL